MITQLYLHEMPCQKSVGSSEERWQFIRIIHQQQKEALNNIKGTETVAFRNLITNMLKTNQNTVISPATLLCSLLFLSEVCGKKTQNEILRALCCTGDKAGIVSDIIRKSIIGDSRISKCHIGNSFWVHASVPIQEDILSEVCKAHHSDAFMGEMGSGEINSAIQQWLNNNTGDTMKEHASVCTDRNTLFELFSASLFKAKWCDEFCPSQTQKDCFHVDMSTDVYCYFMSRNECTLCNCGHQYTAVSKDMYMDYQMWFILPDKGVSLNALLHNHNVLKLLSNPSSMPFTKYDVSMSIPKFDIASDLDIKSTLQTMGIKTLFNKASTDVSPVTLGLPLRLDKAKHVGRVKITEDGVEAASYADFGLAKAGGSPKLKKIYFKLDRPFLFAITKSNKVPLYVGTVCNPLEH